MARWQKRANGVDMVGKWQGHGKRMGRNMPRRCRGDGKEMAGRCQGDAKEVAGRWQEGAKEVAVACRACSRARDAVSRVSRSSAGSWLRDEGQVRVRVR